jgi:hypothetical protein
MGVARHLGIRLRDLALETEEEELTRSGFSTSVVWRKGAFAVVTACKRGLGVCAPEIRSYVVSAFRRTCRRVRLKPG